MRRTAVRATGVIRDDLHRGGDRGRRARAPAGAGGPPAAGVAAWSAPAGTRRSAARAPGSSPARAGPGTHRVRPCPAARRGACRPAPLTGISYTLVTLPLWPFVRPDQIIGLLQSGG